MRKEERRVPTYSTETVFIAADGKEFYSETDCQNYELSIMEEKPKVLTTAIKNVKSFWDENPATIYHIESIDDWVVLKNYIWKKDVDWGEYVGPGDYIAIEYNYDYNDYETSYSVYEINSYCSDILADANYYKKHIIEIIEQNT